MKYTRITSEVATDEHNSLIIRNQNARNPELIVERNDTIRSKDEIVEVHEKKNGTVDPRSLERKNQLREISYHRNMASSLAEFSDHVLGNPQKRFKLWPGKIY